MIRGHDIDGIVSRLACGKRNACRRPQARCIPTLLLLPGGREVARQVEVVPAERLLAWTRQEVAVRLGD
ncbi:MAG: hypothetical protein ACRDTH_17900 [Pseudonocardiaceae bacterium]